MRITYAQFNIEYREKFYSVQMGVQHTHENATSAHVTVITIRDDGSKRVISSSSIRGRQIVSPYNAKKALRDALISEGVIKEKGPRDPEPKFPTDKQVEDLGRALDERAVEALEKQQRIDFKTTGGPVNDNTKPPEGKVAQFIKNFFKH